MSSAFSLVRFSPDPEEIEHVNVGILLWTGTHRLLIDERYPKLNCIAAGVSPRLLSEQLQYIATRLERVLPEDVHGAMAGMTSQFALIGPRFMSAAVDVDVANLLVRRYLQKRRAVHAAREERDWQTASMVEQFLGELAIPANRILRRAHASEFLSPAVARHVHDMTIQRVISGQKDLVLLEGLDLARATPTYAVQSAQRIAYNYFRLERAHVAISKFEGRQLCRAVVLFGEPDHEKKDFALAVARRDADVVVPAGRPQPDFVRIVQRAAASVLAPS